jgi:hypothetical protein
LLGEDGLREKENGERTYDVHRPSLLWLAEVPDKQQRFLARFLMGKSVFANNLLNSSLQRFRNG